jgi:membrane-bound lytic murein transglycosylase D
MKKKLSVLLTTCIMLFSELLAQQVPSRMEFANMDLRLTAGAIKDIQADVDALTRSEKFFQKKLERVDMYMPIIERIFKEEGLPDDFKYLVIQESALVSDAVSSSNAVGFWQFKEISGLENNLRIDRHVDERMNIVSSSRAAATYLKSHNSYFDNWAYALIAYQRGRGGAADVIDEANFGKKHLKITRDSYWYLKKFLAHKIAFENVLGSSKPPYYLKEVNYSKGTDLKAIAKEEDTSIELLEEYNKWIKRGKIPADKEYTVIVPLSNLQKIEKLQNQKKAELDHLPGEIDDRQQQRFPLVDHYPSKSDLSIPHEVEINGLAGIFAPKGYSVSQLAKEAEVDEAKFRKWNDLKPQEKLQTGRIYYLRRKRNRAKFYYHTVVRGESMWEISQKYGLKIKKLYRKNRMEPPQQPREGRVLWLRHNRQANMPVEFRDAPSPSVQETAKNTTIIEEQNKIDQQIIDQKIETVDELPASSDPTVLINEEEIQNSSSQIAEDSILVDVETNESAEIVLDEKNITQEDSLNIEKQEEEMIRPELTNSEQEDLDEEAWDESDFMQYAIKKGDTFFSIANRFNMRISTLLNVNSLNIRDTLSIGQIIKVSKGQPASPPTVEKEQSAILKETAKETSSNKIIEHKVTSGDTMYGLAKKYNVSLKEIMEWNGKADYHLKEGELILIKEK